MGRSSTVPDNRPPPPSSEELVTRLFKGLGVPLYEPRIPATYQQEIVSSALKNYRWGAFDLSIYHDTMLTIAKPPPTPPAPVVEPPPAPPVQEIIESPLLLTNAPEPEPELVVPAPKPLAIEPVPVSVQPSAKVRLASQKVQPSSKAASFSTKMSLKVSSGDASDFKDARSVKRVTQSTKGLSIKVSAPNSPTNVPVDSPKSPKSPTSPKAEEVPIVETVVLSPPSQFPVPEPEPTVKPTELVEEPTQSSEIESEQLIDGLLDLSIAYSTAAAGYATNVSRTPKSIKIPDSSVSSKSKSVKSPTSFFSGLMSSLSTKVSSVVSEGGKSTKTRKNVDFAALGIDDPDSVQEQTTEASAAAAEPTNAEENVLTENAPIEFPKEAEVEETEEAESQFNFLSEAAQLAAEIAEESDGEKSTEARQSGSPLTVFPAPIASFSPEGKQPQETKIISPAERSVFKPTFAMPRPVPLQQDPIAALLVSDLRGGKRFALQTEVSPTEGPLSGPKSKRKRNSFGSLEEAGLDAEGYPRLPAKAGKYVAEMLESDSENEILTARAEAQAQAQRQERQTRKTKKKTKENDRDKKELNFAKNQLGPDGEPAKVKVPKQAKPSPKQQQAAKQWYMAGAYSSHHEAIDAINRMHKLLAAQSPHKHGDDADLDDTFRLQRDLSRMQWVVECNDFHQKALILSHATRSPVVPEKDKSKFRNIMNAVKEPAAQGPGAALYHSPTQRSTEKEHKDHRDHREHKHGDEMYLRERDAFHEQHLRQVKHNLPEDFKEEGAHASPPPRQQQHGAEGGTRFPPIPQAQQAPAQPKKGKRGKQ